MSAGNSSQQDAHYEACHRVLGINQLVDHIIGSIGDDRRDHRGTMYNLALTNKTLADNTFRHLWSKKEGIIDFIKLLPDDMWREADSLKGRGKTIVLLQVDFERATRLRGYAHNLIEFIWHMFNELPSSPSIYHFFDNMPEGFVLFPKLRTVHWEGCTPGSLALLPGILGPSVIELHVSDYIPAYACHFECIPKRSPNLLLLEISRSTIPLNLCEEDPFPHAILDGLNLSNFEIGCQLSAQAFLTLSAMSRLENISLTIDDNDEFAYLDFPSDVPCLPSLQSINVDTPLLDDFCEALVKSTSSSTLEDIRVRTMWPVETDMVSALAQAASAHRLRSFALIAGDEVFDQDVPESEYEVTLNTLSPLLQISSMIVLHLEIGSLALTPGLFHRFGRAFPVLEELVLYVSPTQWPTLDALTIIADAFPILRRVVIPLSVRDIPPIPNDWKSSSIVYMMEIKSGPVPDQTALAEYLQTVFPRLQTPRHTIMDDVIR
ncbi:uncharacterized protein LAESUDRAFT_711537 [Laetiporus sulphureus 93-53]|uniref:F-box domain-containing protein n=1 Tax=Laetiporus sulphureus 93-53 TaxID=1314785 RepID=A0A165GGQ9_9APHY|nr:uncharacterized protein LAESUDRAFT_711537 [Laetiporus sulphureus 93-53]KZT10320.1 hypothetical protein LAESUDRAFT_711537 [Laetiporus sulphureus 93-53]